MKNVQFWFEAYNGSKYKISMERASSLWCNCDCPDIYSKSADAALDGWRINSGGLYMESLPEEMRQMFIRFVKSSSEAFYRKYPKCQSVPGRNGFMENLARYNKLEAA